MTIKDAKRKLEDMLIFKKEINGIGVVESKGGNGKIEITVSSKKSLSKIKREMGDEWEGYPLDFVIKSLPKAI